jgi:hypothetical protein
LISTTTFFSVSVLNERLFYISAVNMHSTELLVDDDMTGDDSYGSMTFAFGEDDPVEGAPFMTSDTDQLRLSYMEDVFEDSDDTVSAWKSVPYFSGRININEAESRMLASMKTIIQPIPTKSSQFVHKQLHSMKTADFVASF